MDVNRFTKEDYKALKREVEKLYQEMMLLHADRRRDAVYANARRRYMEKKSLMQQVLEAHPNFLD